MAIGLLDRCCSPDVMMRFPAIYRMSQNRSDFNIKVHKTISDFSKKLFVLIDFLDLVPKCSLSFYYSLFHVLCYASTWYV